MHNTLASRFSILVFPPREFFITRRLGIAILFSIGAVIFFESFFTSSYSIQSFNYAWETPISYLLGPVSGCILANSINSVAPEMEKLAVVPIRLWRTLTAISLAIFQLVFAAAWIPITNFLFLEPPMRKEDYILFALAALFFQGLGMLSGALFSGYKIWILPLLGVLVCVGFGFNADSTPRPHHILVYYTPLSAVICFLVFILGIFVLLFLRPNFLETRREYAR